MIKQRGTFTVFLGLMAIMLIFSSSIYLMTNSSNKINDIVLREGAETKRHADNLRIVLEEGIATSIANKIVDDYSALAVPCNVRTCAIPSLAEWQAFLPTEIDNYSSDMNDSGIICVRSEERILEESVAPYILGVYPNITCSKSALRNSEELHGAYLDLILSNRKQVYATITEECVEGYYDCPTPDTCTYVCTLTRRFCTADVRDDDSDFAGASVDVTRDARRSAYCDYS